MQSEKTIFSLRPDQLDQRDELALAYERHTGRRIDRQDMVSRRARRAQEDGREWWGRATIPPAAPTRWQRLRRAQRSALRGGDGYALVRALAPTERNGR